MAEPALLFPGNVLPSLSTRRSETMNKSLVATALTLAIVAPYVAWAPAASAASLAGVDVPDRMKVGDDTLVLNGLGLREKFFVDVYVGALYLPKKDRSEQSIFAADSKRQVSMHFVHDVTKEQICEAWAESLEANRPKASAELKKEFDTLCSYMETVEDGGAMTFTYVPGEGTSVSVNGKAKGTIGDKAFADALFASWIGQHPATEKLKKGMLGG
jgi:Chalcone isomerase-like